MNYQKIEDIYAANDLIRENLQSIIADLTDEQATTPAAGEQWTVAQIVEHLSIVEDGMTRISAKLLKAAQDAGKTSDGAARLSAGFVRKSGEMRGVKVEAPDRVRPTGKLTIGESLAKMKESRQRLNELKPLFEQYESADFTFPHPFLGALTATEWLALIGGHEARHIEQIKRILG